MISSSDNGWSYGKDSSEHSFINYENGIERMIVGLDIKPTSRDEVLVVPLPSKPATVTADILAALPEFKGFDLEERAHTNLRHMGAWILLSQLYPILPIGIANFIFDSMQTATGGGVSLDFPGSFANSGVTVYQHLEKEGMIAEVLTAADSTALYDYLKSKGLRVEKDSIPIFKDYIRDDYSFVVSWIDPTKADITALGLFMSFPTREMYYPLKPGSAYEGAGSRKVITVTGYVSPQIYQAISYATEIKYYYSKTPLVFKDFFDSQLGFGYTNITITASPKSLIQDLVIENRTPLKIKHAEIVSLHPFVYGILIYILLTLIATWLTLRFIPGSSVKSRSFKYLFILNLLTLIGTIVGSKRYLSEKRKKYVIIYTLLFVAISCLVMYPLVHLYVPDNSMKAALDWIGF